jgi:hypothetical protein
MPVNDNGSSCSLLIALSRPQEPQHSLAFIALVPRVASVHEALSGALRVTGAPSNIP